MNGIYTPNITPIDARGRVDEDKLCGYVDWLIERGVHGLYPNGSTGEFTRFTAPERRRIIEIPPSTRGGTRAYFSRSGRGQRARDDRRLRNIRCDGCPRSRSSHRSTTNSGPKRSISTQGDRRPRFGRCHAIQYPHVRFTDRRGNSPSAAA
ncbi:MAG: dihydrodipicolinate synthase family protein [Pirellulaceae bacterium]